MNDKSYYAQHQDLLKTCIMAGQKKFPTLRLFPAQVGNFYVKRFVDKKTYTFEGPYKIGTKGQADLNGVIKISGIGIRVEVEVKSGKTGVKEKSDQGSWRKFCKAMGVIYIEATSPEQFIKALKEEVDAKVRQLSEVRK